MRIESIIFPLSENRVAFNFCSIAASCFKTVLQPVIFLPYQQVPTASSWSHVQKIKGFRWWCVDYQ